MSNANTIPKPEEALLGDAEIFAATARCIDGWNTLDLEKTLATYHEEVVYRDPGTNGRIEGRAALRRYLTKFFDIWEMIFHVTEDRRIAGSNAQVCLWDVEIKRKGSTGPTITCSGMDIIHVRDGVLSRDEAFMDRMPLQPLRHLVG